MLGPCSGHPGPLLGVCWGLAVTWKTCSQHSWMVVQYPKRSLRLSVFPPSPLLTQTLNPTPLLLLCSPDSNASERGTSSVRGSGRLAISESNERGGSRRSTHVALGSTDLVCHCNCIEYSIEVAIMISTQVAMDLYGWVCAPRSCRTAHHLPCACPLAPALLLSFFCAQAAAELHGVVD